MKPLDQLLEDWRDLLKISKSEAARRCDMSPQHWDLLTTGQRLPRPGTYRKLADGTGIPIERLLAAGQLLAEGPDNSPADDTGPLEKAAPARPNGTWSQTSKTRQRVSGATS